MPDHAASTSDELIGSAQADFLRPTNVGPHLVFGLGLRVVQGLSIAGLTLLPAIGEFQNLHFWPTRNRQT